MITKNRWTASALALVVASTLSCDAAKKAAQLQEAVCCTEFKVGADLQSLSYDITDQGALGAFRAFMQAASDFAGEAASMADEVSTVCSSLAQDLGAPATAVPASVTDPSTRASMWCAAARAQIAMVAPAGMVMISVQEPGCSFSASAQAHCEAGCTSNVMCTAELGDITARCTPGKLTGRCDAMCSGSCTGSAEVAVSCQGTCSGSCEGTCMGTCTDAGDGAGGSSGTACRGTCSGMCMGRCRGECQIAAQAQVMCEAQCSGGCSIAYKAPKCTVELKPPSASCTGSAECHASCKASASVHAECHEGKIVITGAGTVSPAILATLKLHIPHLYTIAKARGKLLLDNLGALVQAGVTLTGKAPALSVKAGACVIPAAAAVSTANDVIRSAVEASKSVSAAVGLMGS